MQITLPMVRTATGLSPTNERGREMLAKIKPGDRTMIRVMKPRNIRQHNLLWALLTAVGDAKGVSAEQVLLWLKVQLGRVDFIDMGDGKPLPHPQSISFESMTQDEFRVFFDEAVRAILENILPTLTQSEFTQKIEGLAA